MRKVTGHVYAEHLRSKREMGTARLFSYARRSRRRISKPGGCV